MYKIVSLYSSLFASVYLMSLSLRLINIPRELIIINSFTFLVSSCIYFTLTI